MLKSLAIAFTLLRRRVDVPVDWLVVLIAFSTLTTALLILIRIVGR